MLHIDLLNEEGKQRHHTLLHEAEQWRRQQRTQAHQPRLWDRLRIYLGSRLVAPRPTAEDRHTADGAA